MENESMTMVNHSTVEELDVDSLLYEDRTNVTEAAENVSDYIRELCGKPWDNNEVNHFRWWVLGILTTLVAVLGIIGNLISLLILCSRSMSSMFNHLLACLCGADTLFLVTNVIITPVNMEMASIDSGLYSYIFPMVECCSHFSLSLSIFLIISITIERYQAVCFPHYYQIRAQTSDNVSLILRHIIPSVILSLLFNTPRFISITSLGFKLQEIPAYFKFLLFFQIFHPFSTTGVVPLVLLTTLNYKVYSHMSETRYFHSTRRSTRDFLLAKVMTVLVIVFLALNLPRLCIGFQEVTSIKTVETCSENGLFFNVSKTTYIADFFARFCVVINSSINFIIYCMFGSEFRRHLFLRFGKGLLATTMTHSSSQSRLPGRVAGEVNQTCVALQDSEGRCRTILARTETNNNPERRPSAAQPQSLLSLSQAPRIESMGKEERTTVDHSNGVSLKLNLSARESTALLDQKSLIETHL